MSEELNISLGFPAGYCAPSRTGREMAEGELGRGSTENDPEDFYPETHLPKPLVTRWGKVPFTSLDTDSSDDC